LCAFAYQSGAPLALHNLLAELSGTQWDVINKLPSIKYSPFCLSRKSKVTKIWYLEAPEIFVSGSYRFQRKATILEKAGPIKIIFAASCITRD
jgi:hypothetical protein